MKTDGRRLSHETLETIRNMEVQRVVEDGEKASEVIPSYGLCRTTIYRWLRAYRKGGGAALESRPATGRPCRLTPKQKQQVGSFCCGKEKWNSEERPVPVG